MLSKGEEEHGRVVVSSEHSQVEPEQGNESAIADLGKTEGCREEGYSERIGRPPGESEDPIDGG